MKAWEEPVARAADFFSPVKRLNLPPPMSGPRVLYLALARQALELGLRAIPDPLRRVAIPDYVCVEVPNAIRRAGFDVDYYRVTNNLKPELESLSAVLRAGVCAVVVVHYFGFPTPLNVISELCEDNSTILIEDCAHCFGTTYNGQPVGRAGTFSIFSFRKFMPTPDGACLVVNDPKLWERVLQLPETIVTSSATSFSWAVREVFKIAGLSGMFPLLHRLLCIFRRTKANAVSVSMEIGIDKLCQFPSALTNRIASRYPWIELVNQRRNHYKKLLELTIESFDGSFVFENLPAQGGPLFFPIRLPNAHGVADKMRAMGVIGTPWPKLPSEVREASWGMLARNLSEEILGLPIHSQASPEYIAQCFKKAVEIE